MKERSRLSYPERLLRKLRQPDHASLCDFKILVGGKWFLLHKAVICCSSDMLKAMVESDWSEANAGRAELSGISAEAFQVFVDFVYLGSVSVTPGNMFEAFAAARYLLCEQLVDELRPRIICRLNAKTAVATQAIAEAYSDSELCQKSDEYMLKNFSQVMDSDDFVKMSVDTLERYLCSDDNMIHRHEYMAIDGIYQWVTHRNDNVMFEESSVSRDFARLIACVRFGTIPTQILKEYSRFPRSAVINGRAIGELIMRFPPHSLPMVYILEADSDEDVEIVGRFGDAGEEAMPRGRLRRLHEPMEPSSSQDLLSSISPQRTFRLMVESSRNLRFDFEIPKCMDIEASAGVQTSPWYSSGPGFAWRLEVYPTGVREDVTEHMSVYVRCSDSSTQVFQIKATFSLCIIEQNFGTPQRHYRAEKEFSTGTPCHGKAKFADRTSLRGHSLALRSPEGSVVIGANITWTEEGMSELP